MTATSGKKRTARRPPRLHSRRSPRGGHAPGEAAIARPQRHRGGTGWARRMLSVADRLGHGPRDPRTTPGCTDWSGHRKPPRTLLRRSVLQDTRGDARRGRMGSGRFSSVQMRLPVEPGGGRGEAPPEPQPNGEGSVFPLGWSSSRLQVCAAAFRRMSKGQTSGSFDEEVPMLMASRRDKLRMKHSASTPLHRTRPALQAECCQV